MFWECFHFNCRIHMRTAAFLLAAAASIVFSAVSQLPYFEHYQLTSASDLEQISERLPTDATVPASSREQLQLTVESTRRILTRELRLPDSDDILSKLQERLSVKTDWSVRELDELWEELVSEHGGLVMLSPRYLSNSFIGHSRKPASLEELVQYAYSGHDFSDFLSVEFGQSLSLINAILFSVFFSALFLDDVKQGKVGS